LLDPDGRIVRFNAACEQATGYTAAEVEGRRIWDVLTPPEDRPLLQGVLAALNNGTDCVEHEGHWLCKDGGRRCIAWACTRVCDRSGRLSRIIATGLDLTELRRLEDGARQTARLATVGQLAGGVAHDFNNLLTAIMGYIGFVLPELPEDSRVAEDLRLAIDAATRASQLTRQLLTFTRGAGSPSACIDVNGVVRDTCSVLRHLIEDRVDLRVELCPEPLPVRADPVQLGQVVMNLVVNARDAMPGGGVLTVRTARQDAPAGGAGRARLSVSDTGSGIPEDIRERIFEPFFTTKAGGSAAGLGLATVDRIVRQHDGQVALESRLGGGSTFTVRLPLVEADSSARRPAARPDRSGRGQRVLVVEDDIEVRDLARRVLRDCGYAVWEAADGPAALALLERTGAAPDVLITDVVMPRMDGRELAQRVRLRHPQVRILFISGHAHTHAGEDLGDQLAWRFVHKPFSMERLVRRVREALQEPV